MAAQEYLCTVRTQKKLTPTVFELAFSVNSLLQFSGGQFISVVIPKAGPNGRDLRRAYSIASPPEAELIELCIKQVDEGPGSGFLHSLKPGDTFRAYAPYGDFVYDAESAQLGRHACFIATGTGIAPFRSMLLSKRYHTHPPKSGICLLGVRAEDEILYAKELNQVAGLRFIPAVSQPSSSWPEKNGTGFKGRVTDYLRSSDFAWPDFAWKDTEFYLCGNGAMISEVKTILGEKGVSKESIHQEIYYK